MLIFVLVFYFTGETNRNYTINFSNLTANYSYKSRINFKKPRIYFRKSRIYFKILIMVF